MNIEQTIQEIEAERKALAARLEILEKEKRKIMQEFQKKRNITEIENKIKANVKKYQLLQKDFNALAEKLEKLKIKKDSNQ